MALEAPAVHRLTYDDVMRMCEAGILDPEARVELLDGVLIDLPPTGPEHDGTVAWVTKRFVLTVGDAHEVRIQSLFRLPGGDFVVPDAMVVDAGLGRRSQPTTAALVIEVAFSSQRHDADKANRYALAGVDEYWVVDGVVRVHRDPSPTGYGAVTEHRDGELAPRLGVPPVPVSELLGT